MKFTRKVWYGKRWTLYWEVHRLFIYRYAMTGRTRGGFWIRLGSIMFQWHKARDFNKEKHGT